MYRMDCIQQWVMHSCKVMLAIVANIYKVVVVVLTKTFRKESVKI